MPRVPQWAMAAKATANWVCDRLDAAYGPVVWRSHGDPLDGLIQTILSPPPNDTNCERAFNSLRRTFPGGWRSVAEATDAEVAEAIRCGGLADTKSARIRKVLAEIHARTGDYGLGVLEAMSDRDAAEFLGSLPGVGPKTVACVLMFCLGRPVLPVDTHVFRVSWRLGLIEQRIGEAKAHAALGALVAARSVYPFHVQLIRHGRRVCAAREPRCGDCVLADRCRLRREAGKRARAEKRSG
ncbi:MAG: endonuclease III domain-containing protein [Armatimonadota bacterium]